jgi:transcriptional regulator with XRE-family HTH domain
MSDKKQKSKISNKMFADHVLFDFIDKLNFRLLELGLTRRDFARKLGVSEGRISQIFNNPSNFTMNKMVEWARELGLKVTLVSYEDKDDPSGAPVFSDSFREIWKIFGRPRFEEQIEKIRLSCGNCLESQATNVVWLPGIEKEPIGWNLAMPLSDMRVS